MEVGIAWGITGGLIGAAVSAIVAMIVNGRRNGNPNLGTVDEKLNQILLALTEIKAVIQSCPVAHRGER